MAVAVEKFVGGLVPVAHDDERMLAGIFLLPALGLDSEHGQQAESQHEQQPQGRVGCAVILHSVFAGLDNSALAMACSMWRNSLRS